MLRHFIMTCLATLISFSAMADENYHKRFSAELNDSFPLAKEILAEWDLKGPKDGDYYAAHFNVHVKQALDHIMHMTTYLPLYVGKDYMEMQDSLGNAAGYMYTGIIPRDTAQIDSAITWLRKGIEKFPQRLDLRMGYSTLYRMLDDPQNMYSIMEQTVNWLIANPDIQLTWTSDEPLTDRKAVVDDCIQDYFGNCYYSTAHKAYSEKFADLGLRHSPANAIFWNDKAVLKLEKDDVQGALELMEKAHIMNPDDELITNNINYIKEKLLKDKENNR